MFRGNEMTSRTNSQLIISHSLYLRGWIFAGSFRCCWKQLTSSFKVGIVVFTANWSYIDANEVLYYARGVSLLDE